MGTLLAKNADVVVTMDGQRRELRNAGLFARDGMIEKVGPTAELPESADLVLDLRGHILLPGLINCHHHLDQILTRNLPAGQNTNLFPWLKAHYRVWASRTPEDTRTAVLVGCAELARSGCTTVFDHAYVFKNGCKVDDQIAAAAELGIRFAVSRCRAEACRSASRKAGCRRTIAWRTKTPSSRIPSASSNGITTPRRARCCRSCWRHARHFR
jgi:cytosine/adenosine deaminase-related metal-dependent hydrolase